MPDLGGRVLEGVFAVHKPPRVSSAQVIRDLQHHFRSSDLFAPLLEQQSQKVSRDGNSKRSKQRRAARDVKIGHGGTLDPLATGVLVIGVGKGTKLLNSFLGCTKSYETVLLFGKSTDTYDVAGKVVSEAPYDQVTKALVEEKLGAFRGKIEQVPPIYSALRIDGIRAYNYARTGKELPRELEARQMEVHSCELVEWSEGGSHEYHWPATEASKEVTNSVPSGVVLDGVQPTDSSRKRELSEGKESHPNDEGKRRKTGAELHLARSSPLQSSPSSPQLLSASKKAKLHTHEVGQLLSGICGAPAAKIQVTVSSGFYVRSFAHDLGIACGSLALMASLCRTRQGEFELSNTLTYDDLARGEGAWGPKLRDLLETWMENHSENSEPQQGRHLESGQERSRAIERGSRKSPGRERPSPRRSRERRNTSSAGED